MPNCMTKIGPVKKPPWPLMTSFGRARSGRPSGHSSFGGFDQLIGRNDQANFF
jgi:hypothetical protein